MPLYSAGHTKHEWTSWAAMDMIFDDMDRAMKEDYHGVNSEAEDKDKMKKEEL